MSNEKIKSTDFKKLNAFLKNNKEVDGSKADLLHTPNLEKYKWIEFEDEDEKNKGAKSTQSLSAYAADCTQG